MTGFFHGPEVELRSLVGGGAGAGGGGGGRGWLLACSSMPWVEELLSINVVFTPEITKFSAV